MYRKRSPLKSLKSLPQVSANLSPFFSFQRFCFSISPLRFEYPPDSDQTRSDRPDLHNNNGRTAHLSHLSDFQNLGGNPNGIDEKRSNTVPTLYPSKSDKGNFLNGNGVPREIFDFSRKHNSRYSENLQQNFEGYGTDSLCKSRAEGSRISGKCNNLNNLQSLGGDSNEILEEVHNNTYDLRNSMNMRMHGDNSQATNYMKEGPAIGNQNVGKGVLEERYNFSPNSQHNTSNQQQPFASGAKSFTGLKQNANGYQTSNQVNDFDDKNKLAGNLQSNWTRVGNEVNPMNNVHNANDNQRAYFSRHANVNQSYQQNPYGLYSTNLQHHSSQQFNANGIYRENSNGHNNHFKNAVSGNVNQFNHQNNGQNMGANQHGAYARNSASTHNNSEWSYASNSASTHNISEWSYSRNSESTHNNTYGYRSNNPGEAQQWKHGGFNKDYQNGHMNNTHNQDSTFSAQFDHTNNVQNLNTVHLRNGIEQVNYQQYNYSMSENLTSNNGHQIHYMNSIGELNREGSRNSDKGLGVDDGYPYDGANGIFRRSNIMLDPEPSKSYIPSSEQINQGLSYNGLTETIEIISFEDCMCKLEAFCAEGKVKEAVGTLAVIEKIGMCIDVSSYLKLLKVCGKAKSLDNAKIVHAHLSWSLDDIDVSVHNEIIDMYSKCGSVADVNKLFQLIEKNNTSWETMIKGLANNGLGEEAIDLFKEFKKTGLKPDGSLFNALFYTCGVLSAVDQGLLYFESMRVDYGISPTMENYASIVEMLGRSGHLDEALEFIESLHIESNVELWFTLMNYCIINGYMELGNRCAEVVDQLDSSKLTDESRKGLLPLKSLELLKENEFHSNNDYDNQKHQTHEYMAGRTNDHVMNERIRCLAHQLKEAGYVPDIACTLHDVDPENREEALMFHSERLAMVHAFMITPPRREVRIIKNLRACRDCHNVMKIVSKFTGRMIIARDSKRFHHFSNGKCSCNDFW